MGGISKFSTNFELKKELWFKYHSFYPFLQANEALLADYS